MATGIENTNVKPPKALKMRGLGGDRDGEMSVTSDQQKAMATEVAKMPFYFLPGSGEYLSAKDYFRDYKETLKNVKEGKPIDAATSGIMAFLAGVGMLPVVGYGPRILRKGLQKGKDIYDAYRASRTNKDLDVIANPEANEIEDLGTTMLPVIQESRIVDEVTQPTTSVEYKMGDVDVPTGMMQDDVPFYSRGLEVLDNIDYNEFIKTGNVKRIRAEKKFKNELLSPRMWQEIFTKNDVPVQELDETGVSALLREAKKQGVGVSAEDIRSLLVQNPVRNVKVSQYGGPRETLPLDVKPEMDVIDRMYRESDLIDRNAQMYQLSEKPDEELVEAVQMIVDTPYEEWIQASKAYEKGPDNDEIKRRLVDKTIALRDAATGANKLVDNSIVKAEEIAVTGSNRIAPQGIDLTANYLGPLQDNLLGIIDKTNESPFISWPKISKFEFEGLKGYKEPRHNNTSWNIGGGKDYGEFVFYSPTPKGQTGKKFADHFDETNPIAHVRFDSRKIIDDPNTNTVDMNAGDEVLFIQELQSDIHQGSRSTGMMPNPDIDLTPMLRRKLTELLETGKSLDESIGQIAKSGFDITPDELQELQKLMDMEITNTQALGVINRLESPIMPNQGDMMPFMPLQGNMAWGDYTIKYMANKALQGGKKWLAIAPADYVSNRPGNANTTVAHPKLGDTNFYGSADQRTVKAQPKSGDPRYQGQEYVDVDTSKSIVPRIFKKLAKIDPSREPLKVATITINGPNGDPIKVLALQIDDRFDRAFTLYKREGGIVTLPITWYK